MKMKISLVYRKYICRSGVGRRLTLVTFYIIETFLKYLYNTTRKPSNKNQF